MARNRLFHGVLTTSTTKIFGQASATVTVTAATVQNLTANAVTLDVWMASGGSAADASLVFENLSVAANSAVGLPLLVGHTMNRLEELFARANTADALVLRVSGDVVTG